MPWFGRRPTRAEEETLLESGERKVLRLWSGFVDFALQGNIIEIALGLM